MKTPSYCIGLLLLLLFRVLVYAGTDIDTQASSTANLFIEGVKISELKEGKQMLANTSWGKIEEIPELINCEKIYEGMFQTDIPGISGYKQLLRIKAQSEAGTELTKKYMLIVYKDRLSETWKVFQFRESVDTSEYQIFFKKRLGNTRPAVGLPIKDQFNYKNYGYWLIMDGMLSAAKSAFLKASELNKIDPAPDFNQNECYEYIEIINRIIGSDK